LKQNENRPKQKSMAEVKSVENPLTAAQRRGEFLLKEIYKARDAIYTMLVDTRKKAAGSSKDEAERIERILVLIQSNAGLADQELSRAEINMKTLRLARKAEAAHLLENTILQQKQNVDQLADDSRSLWLQVPEGIESSLGEEKKAAVMESSEAEKKKQAVLESPTEEKKAPEESFERYRQKSIKKRAKQYGLAALTALAATGVAVGAAKEIQQSFRNRREKPQFRLDFDPLVTHANYIRKEGDEALNLHGHVADSIFALYPQSREILRMVYRNRNVLFDRRLQHVPDPGNFMEIMQKMTKLLVYEITQLESYLRDREPSQRASQQLLDKAMIFWGRTRPELTKRISRTRRWLDSLTPSKAEQVVGKIAKKTAKTLKAAKAATRRKSTFGLVQ
jgi:hypothetical protein